MDPFQWAFCQNIRDVKKVIRYVKKTKVCSFDFETDGNPYHSPASYPTTMSISFQPGSAYAIPLGHHDSPMRGNYQEVLHLIGREIMEDPEILKIAHNADFELKWFMKHGIFIRGRLFDTMLAKYLLDENTPNALEYLYSRFLPEYSAIKKQETDDLGKERDWAKKPLIPLSKYCCGDASGTLILMNFFEPRLVKAGMYNIFRNLLCMGTKVLGEATFKGVHIDVPYLDTLVDKYQREIDELLYQVKNHKVVKRFDYKRLEAVKLEMIQEIRDEISQINKEISDGLDSRQLASARRKIKSREDKIARYTVGDFTTNKELKKIAPFNMNSVPQMRELFFTSKYGFKFKPPKYTVKKVGRRKVETDNPSTDEDSLLLLKPKDKTGFVDLLLKFRELDKLFGTYIKGMRQKVGDDGKIHGRFLLHGTVTGRLSSREPNLQNIPRDTTAGEIKRMFIPPPGYLFFQLDYSQAELRVLAAAAGEKTMIEWFKTGRDIHLASACKKYNEDYDDIIKIYSDEDHPEYKKWKIRRKQAKTINFGIVYGQGPAALAGSLSDPESGEYVSTDEAKKFLKDFDRTFPMIAQYIKRIHKGLPKDGFVTSVWGRKRRLPGIWDQEWGVRAKAQRDAINAPIQGAASDYTLFSSILIWENIKAGIHPFTGLEYRMTVHDSLIYYIKPEIIHEVVPKLEAICANPKTMEYFGFQIDDVYMKVDFEVGKHWGDLQGYKPDVDYTTWV